MIGFVSGKEPPVCQDCGQSGHMSKRNPNCPKHEKTHKPGGGKGGKGGNGKKGGKGNQGRGDIKCKDCGQEGHRSRFSAKCSKHDPEEKTTQPGKPALKTKINLADKNYSKDEVAAMLCDIGSGKKTLNVNIVGSTTCIKSASVTAPCGDYRHSMLDFCPVRT